MVNITADWTINYFPEYVEKKKIAEATYDDASWKAVAHLNTWQTFETTGDIHPFVKSPSERDDPYWWKGWAINWR